MSFKLIISVPSVHILIYLYYCYYVIMLLILFKYNSSNN